MLVQGTVVILVVIGAICACRSAFKSLPSASSDPSAAAYDGIEQDDAPRMSQGPPSTSSSGVTLIACGGENFAGTELMERRASADDDRK